jgi:hypothetical protein
MVSRHSKRAMMRRMGRARVYKGEAVQGERPEWGPLRDVVGEQVMGDSMWMYEVTLTDGTALHVYKHIDTRRSVHLASDGTVFVYEPPDRYRRHPAADVFAEVFRDPVTPRGSHRRADCGLTGGRGAVG